MNRSDRRAAAKAGKTPNPVTAMWFSNAPWAGTGYGTQTKQVVERMKRDGHNVAVAANYGLQAMTTEYDGVPIYPMGFESYSNDVAAAHYKHWTMRHPNDPAHLFVLFDAWVLKGPHWDELPVSIWTMVDHVPVPVGVSNILKKPNITPIAVTRFGQDEIERQGIACEYIPMAIDTNLYKPTATYEGVPGRQMMELPEDTFVVTMAAANKGLMPVRKAFGENLLAFSIFAEKHPDARLYLHTERHGNMGGIQFDPLLRAVGLKPHQYSFVNQYANLIGIPNEAMAALYTATDVLLAASMSEGFGLTVLEAAACGTRAIVNDFSAQPELVSEDSWLTEGQPWWDPSQFAWENTPNIPSIVDALEEAYAKGRTRSQAQMDHAAKYDADLVWDQYWRPYMARVASGDIGGSKSVVPDTFAPDRQWVNDVPNHDAQLSIVIPAYRANEATNLLADIAAQATPSVEVIVVDDDPAGGSLAPTRTALDGSPAFVYYERNATRLGGEANLLHAYQQGRAPWVWVIGDDDRILPGGLAEVLRAIERTDADRLILRSDRSPEASAGLTGTMADVAALDPGLPIAATLISANVVRRSSLDIDAANAHSGTMYSHSWALTGCKTVAVLPDPVISVGNRHGGEFLAEAGFTGDVGAVWNELLRDGFGIEPTPEHFSWNYAALA